MQIKKEIYAGLLTIDRYTQEKSIGNVDHGAAQQTEDIHMTQTVHVIQVSLCGRDANLRCLLQTRTRQSWRRKVFPIESSQIFCI